MQPLDVMILGAAQSPHLRACIESLQRLGHHPQMPRCADVEGFAKALANAPDLLLVEVSGGEVVDALLSRGPRLQCPLVLLVSDEAAMADLSAAAGAVPANYVRPPVRDEELHWAIGLALGQVNYLRRQGEALGQASRQLQSLANANVRMTLLIEGIERIRQAETRLNDDGDIDAFYDLVIEDLMSLTGAVYGAMGLFDNGGRMERFLTRGMDERQRERIGHYPLGKGLLAALFRAGRVMCVADIGSHPDAVGFPPGHPPMTSLLGVPLQFGGRTHGAIYLTDKKGGEAFTEDDVVLVKIYATQVEHVLERSALLESLRRQTEELEREQREERALIDKLHSAQDQLLQSEKMASIGQLAAGVAHEINNPVGYISSNIGTLKQYLEELLQLIGAYEKAEVVLRREPRVFEVIQSLKKRLDLSFLRQDAIDLLSESEEGVQRVKRIVQDLKDFSHAEEVEWQFADLHKGLDSTLNIVHNELKYKADVVREYGELPLVECVVSQLNQVFMNLLVNAAHAIEGFGTITVATGREGDWVWIDVRDTGAGIAPEHRNRLFEPFFTTKPVGKGTGLGLSMSYSIVRRHGGRIDVQSNPGEGTTFRVWIPVEKQHGDTDDPQ